MNEGGVVCSALLYSTIIKRHFLQVLFISLRYVLEGHLRLMMRCGLGAFWCTGRGGDEMAWYGMAWSKTEWNGAKW